MCAVIERSNTRAIMNEYFELVSAGDISVSVAVKRLRMDEDTFLDDMAKAGYKMPVLEKEDI